MFSEKDLAQLKSKGISPDLALQQIENFKKGFPYADITAAATVGNGILKLSDNEAKSYGKIYDDIKANEKIVKFVPASGAASRMFKALFEFMSEYNGDTSFLEDNSFASPATFFKRLKDFAFYDDLKSAYEKNYGDFNESDFVNIVKSLLTPQGLNYGNLPKGLLKFHNYPDGARTPAEEHIVEAAEYGASQDKANIHFTVSEEHLSEFDTHISAQAPKYEAKYKLNFEVDYSTQKSATDTIAVDMNNEPFRNEDGTILFRPGGHGALIENLNDINADIIFVKNIDNVVPDSLKPETVTYKKAIAGVLVSLRNQIFKYIKALQTNATEDLHTEILNFFETKLFYKPNNTFFALNFSDKTVFLLEKLNRPVRVCGMVKNEGEPGGGPFFVRNSKNDIGLQIVEGAQIDLNNPEKKQIVDNATHFNPVDLVCAVKDYEGNLFNLTKFTDSETGFISEKSKDGKNLKAQELPGLWNGAMADWNTVFVEVPIITFNPVKIVNDLLREQHQA